MAFELVPVEHLEQNLALSQSLTTLASFVIPKKELVSHI